MISNTNPIVGCRLHCALDGSHRHQQALLKQFTRRNFLLCTTMAAFGFFGPSVMAADNDWINTQLQHFRGKDVLTRISQKAAAENWNKLPIGEVVGKVGLELSNTRWTPFTLDVSRDAEFCVVNLEGMDCFTFIENSLCLARVVKRQKTSPEELIREVEFTLYRDGKMGDFGTRLHYTSDWFFDNEKKGVLEVVTPKLPGAQPFTEKICFMSSSPKSYKQLQSHPELIAKIKAAEDRINQRRLMYLPINKLKDAEHLLKTGDIIGITEPRAGIDIGHCGLCVKDENGGTHFVDASSMRRKMKVIYEPDLVSSVKWCSKVTGVMIARPLELNE